ncbi:AraC family transcriptional regulator [Nocardia sp. NPDC059195]|uniref:AraC family transcriptional regulator n=1 Tax=Nocardia sp. NPDC059195 TaxID=3346765 RepID=UPI0036C04930
MDALAELLYGTRARGAAFGRSILEPPWSLRFVGGAPLTLTTMLSGDAWIVPDSGDPVHVYPGDVAIVTGSSPHTVADSKTTAPAIEVRGSDQCVTSDGIDVSDAIRLDLRTCGERYEGSAVLITGMYQVSGEIINRLLSALPPVLVVPAEGRASPILDLLGEEVERVGPGHQVVIDRMLDLLLVHTVRRWFERPEAEAPGWYRALGDPVVGAALRLLHDAPAQPWTVGSLAGKVGMSRSSLSTRFAALVGEPPMTYLAKLRVTLAGDLLSATDATVGSVAHQVGYADAFALSTAFKRIRGIRPTDVRAAACKQSEDYHGTGGKKPAPTKNAT